MLIIGIDEAGYGPLLGPLCHGWSVVRYRERQPGEPVPDLWKLWGPQVCRAGDSERSVEIDDSKRIYAGSRKGPRLTAALTQLLWAAGQAPVAARDGLLLSSLLDGVDYKRILDLPWGAEPVGAVAAPDEPGDHATHAEQFRLSPGQQEAAQALARKIRETGCSIEMFQSRALSARDFNVALRRQSSKAEVSWERVGEAVLKSVRLALPGERVILHIDRQGGRKFYAGLLGDLFVGAFVRVDVESKAESIYRVLHRESEVTILFREQAEDVSLPVAMASMAAKWTREILMGRFNAYFCSRQEGLRPTAGYYTDGQRFLLDSLELRRRLGIRDEDLIRSK